MAFATHQSPNQQRLKRFSLRKDDSPSRQLQFDLEHAMNQLMIREHEVTKVHVYQRRTYHEELEARDSARIKAHTAAIDAATSKHEAIREEAETVLRLHLKEQEDLRQRKEEEERQRREREAKEKAERERKLREEADRKAKEERDRKEAEELKAKQVAEEKAKVEAELTARKAREATAEKEKAERERAEKEKSAKEAASKAQSDQEAAARLQQQEQAQQAARAKAKATAVPTGSGFYSASPEAEETHTAYLNLHKHLKQFRKDFWEQAKQNKPLKAVIGDMRRAMRTSVGQLTEDKTGNRKAIERVKTAIVQSLTTIPAPPVKINDFLPPSLHLQNANQTIPSLTIYLLSIFSKAVIAAFATEAAVNPRAAEPVGTLAAQLFSLAELQFPNPTPTNPSSTQNLIPILLCKFHRVAPILFGISGPEATVQGRLRLGWRMEGDSPSSKSYIPDQRHFERMTGLGAGFSSLSLRNFSKVSLKNPYPPTNFWSSLSHVVNTPVEQVTTSHLLLLKSMIDNNALDRFVLFFGAVAVAALREALIAFPARLPESMGKSAAARNLEIMVDGLVKERYFRLT